MSKEILLNRNYLTTGNNIGHEGINLFRCDNGKGVLWI